MQQMAKMNNKIAWSEKMIGDPEIWTVSRKKKKITFCEIPNSDY